MNTYKNSIKLKNNKSKSSTQWEISNSLFPGLELAGPSSWGPVKTKLKISQPTDRSEINADKIADAVVSGNVNPKQIESYKSNTVQTKSIAPAESVNTEASDTINNLSGGQQLSNSEKAYFEPRFGEDFSNVRIHTDSKSAASAEAINAKAYNKGNDIVFAKGEYQPGTVEGNKLMAHELAHVVQQGEGLNRKFTQGNLHTTIKIKDHPFSDTEYAYMRYFGTISYTVRSTTYNNFSNAYSASYQPRPSYKYWTEYLIAGRASQWAKIFKDCDDPDTVRTYVSPFLRAALGDKHYFEADPKSDRPTDTIVKSEDPYGRSTTYKHLLVRKNTVGKAPVISDYYKVEFMKALFSYGLENTEHLDFKLGTDFDFLGPASKLLSRFIKENLPLYVQEISKKEATNPRKLRYLKSANIKDLAGELDGNLQITLVNSASSIATSKLIETMFILKALAKDEIDISKFNTKIGNIYHETRNAGNIIRRVIEVVKLQEKQTQDLVNTIVKMVTDIIPGLALAKSSLKLLAKLTLTSLKHPVRHLMNGVVSFSKNMKKQSDLIDGFLEAADYFEGTLLTTEEIDILAKKGVLTSTVKSLLKNNFSSTVQ